MPIKQISVEDLKAKMDRGEKFKLVDVRGHDEYEVAQIKDSLLIPLQEFPARAPDELDANEEIVIHCHHGGRSQRACQFLADMGYKNLSNLAGGIDAWSVKIDPQVKRY